MYIDLSHWIPPYLPNSANFPFNSECACLTRGMISSRISISNQICALYYPFLLISFHNLNKFILPSTFHQHNMYRPLILIILSSGSLIRTTPTIFRIFLIFYSDMHFSSAVFNRRSRSGFDLSRRSLKLLPNSANLQHKLSHACSLSEIL